MRTELRALLGPVSALGLLVACTAPPSAPPPSDPVPVIRATPQRGTAPLLVRLSAADSYDPGGAIRSYAWDFGDGAPADAAADTAHTFVSVGTYDVRLTVTDDSGSSGSTSVQIEVEAPPTLAAREPIDLRVIGAPIAVKGTGTWDSGQLREAGNVIFDPATERWICVYTGRGDTLNNLGAVVSEDGASWTAHPDNPISGSDNVAEDPYLAKNEDGTLYRDAQGRALMFTEEKDYATHRGVDLWRSAPYALSGWTRHGQVLDRGPASAWDGTDRTSPLVIHAGSRLVMLFEGRLLGGGGGAPDPNEGEVGIAFSDDEGLTWTPQVAPIVTRGPVGSWNERANVPDDLILVGGEWVLLTHGQDSAGQWSEGRYVTTDAPGGWTAGSFRDLPGNPLTTASATVMAWGNDPTQAMWVQDAELRHLVLERR